MKTSIVYHNNQYSVSYENDTMVIARVDNPKLAVSIETSNIIKGIDADDAKGVIFFLMNLAKMAYSASRARNNYDTFVAYNSVDDEEKDKLNFILCNYTLTCFALICPDDVEVWDFIKSFYHFTRDLHKSLVAMAESEDENEESEDNAE